MKHSTRKMLMETMNKDKIPYDRAGQGGDRWQYNPQEDMPFMQNQMRDYAGGGNMGGDRMDGNRDMYDMQDRNYDGRQGVRGTGRYGIGGSQHYPRRDRADGEKEMAPNPDARLWRRYGEEDNEGRAQGTMPQMQGMNMPYDYAGGDRNDYRMDYAQGEIRIKDEDLMKWKHSLMNEDGTKGERFSMQEIMPIAQQMGVTFDKFTPKEFCMVVNMLYSDMCKIWRDVLSPENELHHYVAAAKQWLTDKDALKGSEKLAAYYYFIIDGANEQDGSNDFRGTGMSRR